MRPKMIKAVQRDSGVKHQVYGRRGGRKVYVGTYDSVREAEEAEEDFRVTQRKIERGELPPAVDLNRTLSEAVGEWRASLKKRGSRSVKQYGWSMDALILPVLGDVAIARLTRSHVLRWQEKTVTEYAATTVNAALGALSSACSWFVEHEWIPTNPCHRVRLLEVLDSAYPWIRTVPEIERLLRSCTGEMQDIVACALGTGMRIDELLHLAWDDIDLDARLITIQRGRQGTPKRGMRHVPILDSVLPVLSARALRRGGAFLVFPSRTNKVRSKNHVNVSFKEALTRAGLDLGIRFHDLRHTFASHWVLNGGDIFRLSKILGHKNVGVTHKTYAHLVPEAWQQDYHRVAFRLPTDCARLYRFPNTVPRSDRGETRGRRGKIAAVS